MPTVPTVSGPKEALAGMPDARFAAPQANAPDVQLRPSLLATPQVSGQRIDTPQFKTPLADPGAIQPIRLGDGGAAGYEQAGRDLGRVSDVISQQVQAYQRQVNATMADAGLEQARTAAMHATYGTPDGKGGLVGGYANLKGDQVFRKPDGSNYALDEEVGKSFDDQVREIAKGLTNPDQQYAFNAQVGSIKDQLLQGTLSHYASQFKDWQTEVYTSGAKNEAAAFALIDPKDDKSQADALQRLDQKVASIGILNGQPASAIAEKQTLMRDAAVSALINTAVSKQDYFQASALLNGYAVKKDASGVPYMDPNTAAKYRTELHDHTAAQFGMQLGQAAVQQLAMPAFGTGDADRLANIVSHLEAPGGKDTNPDGSVITSPKGAKGGMQVLDGTNANPGFGVRPAQDNSLAERRRVGQDYLKAMVSRYGGDTQKALAAYNWGPGHLDAALKEYGPDWLAHAPGETQTYVASAQKAYALGGGKPAKPSLTEQYAWVDARTTDPKAREVAYAHIDKINAAAEKDEKTSYEQAAAQVIGTLDANGGDVNQVPAALWGKVDPDKRASLRNYGKGIIEGKDRPSDPATLYALQDDKFLKTLTREQLWNYRPQLSGQNFDSLSAHWSTLQKPLAGDDPKSVNTAVVDDLVKTRLRFMGIDPAPKKTDAAGLARVAALVQFARDDIALQQGQTGKKWAYKDINDRINWLFSRNAQFRQTVFGVTTGHGSEPILGRQVQDIPDADLKQVQDRLTKAGISKPTDSQIEDAYWRHRFYGG